MTQQLPRTFGPYTLEEQIGSGGMARVYRATQSGMAGFERRLAIKMILPHLTENPEFVSMLVDEARIVVGLNHANIAQVYNLNCIENSWYIAMEYVHGPDLKGMLRALEKRGETMPIEHAVFIASGICGGLHVAHHAVDEAGRPLNIVHRDISPHNVLISFAGDVKIIDFGVAKAFGRDNQTDHGVIKGKLAYMAQEHAKAMAVDGRADLFSAGMVLYQMLTNHLPLKGTTDFQTYHNVISKVIEPPRSINALIPPEIDRICMKLLERDPDDRYQTGYDAKRDLERALHRMSPGYSSATLSRFTEENFSVRRPGAPSSCTPSHPVGSLQQQREAPAPSAPAQSAAVSVAERTRAPAARPQRATPAPLPSDTPLPAEPPESGSYPTSGPYDLITPADPRLAPPPPPSDRPGWLVPTVAAASLLFVGLGAFLAYTLARQPGSPSPHDAATQARAALLEPATPRSTTLLRSTPQGAEVHDAKSKEKLGVTPLEITLGEASLEVHLKAPGYEDKFVMVMPDDEERTIELEPAEELEIVDPSDELGALGAPEEQAQTSAPHAEQDAPPKRPKVTRRGGRTARGERSRERDTTKVEREKPKSKEKPPKPVVPLFGQPNIGKKNDRSRPTPKERASDKAGAPKKTGPKKPLDLLPM